MGFIHSFLNTYLPNVSEETVEIFTALVVEKKHKKGDIIVRSGEIPKNLFILKTGIAKGFIIDEKGKEYIKMLYIPVTLVGAASALINKTHSNASYSCLTDCEFLVVNYEEYIKLSEKIHDFTLLSCRMLEGIFIKAEDKMIDLSTLNATERYLKLKKRIPNISNYISQYHIASYLNITPVQLSRIKKKIYHI